MTKHDQHHENTETSPAKESAPHTAKTTTAKGKAGPKQKNRVKASKETMLTIYMSHPTQDIVKKQAFEGKTTISTIIEDATEAVVAMKPEIRQRLWRQVAQGGKSWKILEAALSEYLTKLEQEGMPDQLTKGKPSQD